jgi:hypothetical protein
MSAITIVKFFEGRTESDELENDPLETLYFRRLSPVILPVIVQIAPVCPREDQAPLLPDLIGSDWLDQMWRFILLHLFEVVGLLIKVLGKLFDIVGFFDSNGNCSCARILADLSSTGSRTEGEGYIRLSISVYVLGESLSVTPHRRIHCWMALPQLLEMAVLCPRRSGSEICLHQTLVL